MYAHYWGLSESPFHNTLDERWFYESPAHEEALARLFYLIEQRRRCGLLFGQAGVGKTLLLNVLSQQVLRTQRRLAFVNLLGLDGHELLWQLASAMNLAPADDDTPAVLWRALQDHLRGLQLSQVQQIVLLDHFDQSSADCVSILQRLAHLDGGPSPWTTFVIALKGPGLRGSARLLGDLCDLRLDVPPLDWEHTHRYVHHHLEQAGAWTNLFDPSALEALFELSGGVPRVINRLCDLSLVVGMGENRESINADTVHAAAEELQFEAAPRQTAAL